MGVVQKQNKQNKPPNLAHKLPATVLKNKQKKSMVLSSCCTHIFISHHGTMAFKKHVSPEIGMIEQWKGQFPCMLATQVLS